MREIQEVAEALVNLSVKEVNELSFVIRTGGVEQVAFKPILHDNISTPREYGLKKLNKRRKKSFTKSI